ncbi:MAG: STAS-like domain-containing protein [Bacteroidota bacterium]
MTENKNKYFRNYNCWIEDNTLRFGNMTNQRIIPEFINSLKRLIYKFGHQNIILDFSEVNQVYPFPAVPVSAYIQYFIEKENIEFQFVNMPAYLKKIKFNKPKAPAKSSTNRYSRVLDTIWTFTDGDDVNLLVNGIKNSIRKSIVCEVGTLDAIDWGLNEVMDNVIQHAGINRGFIMSQVLKTGKSLNVCIFDYGQGIYNTLKDTKYNPGNASDAISLCVKEGVTRDKKVGQGNGLWGLYNMVNLNGGHLSIISGKGGLNFNQKDDKIYSYKDIILLNKENQATNINFQLNLGKNISIKEALKGHELVDLFIESLENEYGNYVYKISEAAPGTGTRQSALAVKNEILNIQKQTKKPITLDFSNIGIISSSFADELIAKLIIEFGFFQFQNTFRLTNMNQTVQAILHHSVGMRFADTYNNKSK